MTAIEMNSARTKNSWSSLAERLVDEWFFVDTTDIPSQILTRAALCVKDTLGVAFAARKLGVGTAASRVALAAGGPSHACVWGTGQAASVEDAAFANGMLAHALDFDDTHAAAVMHSSAVVVPSALALGEAHRASGREILAAMVVGYQIAARLGRFAPGPFQDHGFQATGVLGVFAAAAMAARFLGLDRAQAISALGIAGSMSSGLMEYLSDGSDVKQMHPGWAAAAGIRAARLAREGFRGPRTIFEGKFGVFRSFAGTDVVNRWREASGDPWEVASMAPKPYPACLCCHAPVQGILELRKRGVISAAGISQIAGVTCNVPQWYVGLIFEPRATKERPRTPYEARFSAQWCMARALLDGGLDVWSFTREKISDPVAREFAEKVAWSAEELPEFPESFPARVTVTMHDGQRHVAYIAHNLGTPRNPMSAEDIERKFASCSEAAIGAAPTTRLSAAVDSLLLAAGADTFFTQLRSTVVAAGEAKGN